MINRWVGVGHLTKKPEIKYSTSGVPVCRFTLAVNRTFTNQQGEREADFPNIVTFRKTAENVANYLDKGSLVGIEGRIQTSSFDGQDGKRVFMTEVVADSVQFLEPKSNRSEQPNSYQSGQVSNGTNTQQQNQTGGYKRDPFTNSGPVEVNDDDLPF